MLKGSKEIIILTTLNPTGRDPKDFLTGKFMAKN